MSDPLTSLDSMIKRLDPGPRMVDGSILKAVFERAGMAKEAAMIEHGPRLVDEALLREVAVILANVVLEDTFQERGERLVEGSALKALAEIEPGPAAPPVNTSVPAITGTPTVGSTITCTMGIWENEPTSYAYQWRKLPFANIAGATSASYVVQAGDVGSDIYCNVTATNALGSTTVASTTVTIT